MDLSEKERQHRLFVYGTLRTKGPGSAVSLTGKLYNVSWFPGADFNKPGQIIGNVLQIPDSELARIDRYEGYNPKDPESPNNLYTRVEIEVKMLQSGELVKCWAYNYNQDIAPEREIESGDWYAK